MNRHLTQAGTALSQIIRQCATVPPWQAKQVLGASRGQYHRLDNVTGIMSFTFEGEGLRIRYVAAQNMGIFDVIVDDVLIDRVDAYSPERIFPGTRVYTLSKGVHTLTIRSAQQKNNLSEGYVVGLDAIQVFRGSQNMLILTPSAETMTPTSSPVPAVSLEKCIPYLINLRIHQSGCAVHKM